MRPQIFPHTTTSSGLTARLTGVLNMLGYDDRKLGNMALNMILYVGELTANSLLDVDNNIDTEIPQYRSFSDSGDIFSLMKVQLIGLSLKSELSLSIRRYNKEMVLIIGKHKS